MERPAVLCIFCSPVGDGTTAALLKAFAGENTGAYEPVSLDVYSLDIAPCTACGRCASGSCVINDDMDTVYGLIEKAEKIVIATPVYNYSFPAPMKALIDRLQPYFYKAPERHRKAGGYLLAACGQKGVFAEELMNRQTARVFAEIGCGFEGSFFKRETDLNPGLTDEEIVQIRNAGKSFFAV